MRNETEAKELREKIVAGVEKAVEKLIAERKAKDEEITIWKEGKVVTMKARDLE